MCQHLKTPVGFTCRIREDMGRAQLPWGVGQETIWGGSSFCRGVRQERTWIGSSYRISVGQERTWGGSRYRIGVRQKIWGGSSYCRGVGYERTWVQLPYTCERICGTSYLTEQQTLITGRVQSIHHRMYLNRKSNGNLTHT